MSEQPEETAAPNVGGRPRHTDYPPLTVVMATKVYDDLKADITARAAEASVTVGEQHRRMLVFASRRMPK